MLGSILGYPNFGKLLYNSILWSFPFSFLLSQHLPNIHPSLPAKNLHPADKEEVVVTLTSYLSSSLNSFKGVIKVFI